MSKHILSLSVAMAALAAPAALAETSPDWRDITTEITVPVDTAHATPGDPEGTPGDILLDTGGSIVVTTGGAALTINSDNAFKAVTGTTISNKNTANAVGILVDLTTVDRNATLCSTGDTCFFGITEAGAIDLSGTGDTKKGLWLQGPASDSGTGPFKFIGNIDMTGSTISVTGDNSTGIQIDSLAELNGNLTLGSFSMSPTSSTSTAGVTGLELSGVVNGDILETGTMTLHGTESTSAAGTVFGMDLTGTINGNLTIDTDTQVLVTGMDSRAIVLTGDINPCDATVSPGCTSLGSLINKGAIVAEGMSASPTEKTGNSVSSSALEVMGNVAGGIFNAGPAFDKDETAKAFISAQGPASAILIEPVSGATDPIEIDPYIGDSIDPGFAFYNRGDISAVSSNANDSTEAMFIGGRTLDASATLKGGLFNSGTIQAVATSVDGALSTVDAVGLRIGAYGYVGPDDVYVHDGSGVDGFHYLGQKAFLDDFHDERAALVNSGEPGGGGGVISASVSGPLPFGGEANAILIQNNAKLPSIINSGTISAVATTTNTGIGGLAARTIVDQSGSLTYIQNNGTIQAVASVLDDGSHNAIAIDLHADTDADVADDGVLILNQAKGDSSASIIGDILFGTGDYQTVDVEGASTSSVATIKGDITFGGGGIAGSDALIIGSYGTVTGKVTANETQRVNVDVKELGTLVLQNDAVALAAQDFTVAPTGTLDLTLLEDFRSGIIDAAGNVSLESGAELNLTYGSFVPDDSTFVLISAPLGQLHVADIPLYQAQITDNLPFLFASATLEQITDVDNDELVLEVVPKDAAALGLTGYAAQILPFANQALSNDDTLGAAFVAGVTDQKTAQLAYNQMAPNVSGGARAIAIALTDQSSGPVAARQRILRMYGKASGEVTLWGEEFAEFVNDPGDKKAGLTGFKDHGFGFVLGLDGGDPKTGWYGGAFSFYSGDIVEPLPRDSHTNTLWYMLTGYTDWRGRGLFLDTKVDVGYMNLKEKRFLNLTIPNASGTGSTTFLDEADSKRPGLVGAIGFTTGAILAYGSTTFTPQISVDGMTMREEGYTETHASSSATGNGKGMNLQAQSFYASSARIFLGTEIREDLNLGDFFVQPDLRIGYRYDFLNDPTKLKVNFADVGDLAQPTPGPVFTVVGPDPAQGNFVAGASLATTTDAWTLGVNFDFVRGTNGATTEAGTIHLLGRI